MRKLALIIAVIAIGSAAFAAKNSQTTGTKNSQTIGTINLSGWESLQLTGNTIFASGGSPELKTTDGSFYAKAGKMVVTLNEAPKGQKLPSRISAIKHAELTGGVVFSAKPNANRYIKGTGAKLTVIGAEQEAVLDGAGKTVQVEAMDPAVFQKPATLSGDRVRVNLKSNLTPEDWRIKVESSPEKSHLSVTPKPRAEVKQP